MSEELREGTTVSMQPIPKGNQSVMAEKLDQISGNVIALRSILKAVMSPEQTKDNTVSEAEQAPVLEVLDDINTVLDDILGRLVV